MTHVGSVDQILRVDHAGEHGAISIYRGQLLIARHFHPQCVSALATMLSHERAHFSRFDAILKARNIRHCYALGFWALGGWVLGIVTALMGQRAIWACTAAIESTVNLHLEQQVAFLGKSDPEVLAAVQSIRADEEAHESHAWSNGGGAGGIYWAIRSLTVGATSFAIWLSTQL